MKLTLLICLVLVLATVSAARNRVAKKAYVQTPSETPRSPQWNCKRVETVNLRAKEARANGTKCSYLQYIKMKIVEQYTVPQYPSCYAQLDAKCDSNIVDWKEKRTVRKFSTDLQMSCTGAGDNPAQWEDVQTQLDEWREKFGETMNTPYWTCVEKTIAPWIADQYVTFTPFPAPLLDVLNFVCQGVISKIKNVDRIAFNDWMEANGNFAVVDFIGKDLFDDISDKFDQADLHEEITKCYSIEAGYFARSLQKEETQSYSRHQDAGTGRQQATIEFDKDWIDDWPGDGEVFGNLQNLYDGEEGFPSWIYYAPKKHYHETETNVNENTFKGNRAHPLCPNDDMLYLPITMYGPICCEIVNARLKPHTQDCASNSVNQSQGYVKRGKTRLIKGKKECARCQCLEGYEMILEDDYWGFDARRSDNGACREVDHSKSGKDDEESTE